jgi:hypothetical protein
MAPRQDPCQESSSVGTTGCGPCCEAAAMKDSGYKANSIAYGNTTTGAKRESTLSAPRRVEEQRIRGSPVRNAPPDVATPIFGRSDAAGARCGGKREWKKSGCGTARSGKWESAADETTRPWSPLRARWKCAAGPCSRTSRNGRNTRSVWELPRHKTADRIRGTARAATA